MKYNSPLQLSYMVLTPDISGLRSAALKKKIEILNKRWSWNGYGLGISVHNTSKVCGTYPHQMHSWYKLVCFVVTQWLSPWYQLHLAVIIKISHSNIQFLVDKCSSCHFCMNPHIKILHFQGFPFAKTVCGVFLWSQSIIVVTLQPKSLVYCNIIPKLIVKLM